MTEVIKKQLTTTQLLEKVENSPENCQHCGDTLDFADKARGRTACLECFEELTMGKIPEVIRSRCYSRDPAKKCEWERMAGLFEDTTEYHDQ